MLVLLGYGESHLVPIDGIYGENTRLAVMNFQQKKGLEITGTVNYETYLAFFDAYERLSTDEKDRCDTLSSCAVHFKNLNSYLNLLFLNSNADRDGEDENSLVSKTTDLLKRFYTRIGQSYHDEISISVLNRLILEINIENEIERWL